MVVGTNLAFAQIDRSKKPAPAPAKEFKIGDYEKFTLKNGLTVIVVENRKLPRVAFSLIIDRDPLLENDKVGLLGMVGQLMRSGTTNRSKAQLDEEVDFIGANIFTSSTSVFGSSLTKHREKMLDLFTDVLYNPSFPEDELDKIKKQTISGLKSNQDDANAISGNVRSKLLYGADHPYGEIQLESHVENISVDDIKNYYATYFKPNISYLVVVGDISVKDVKKIAKARFGKWESGDISPASYTQPTAPDNNIVALVNRSNSVQTVLNITYPIDLKPGTPEVIQARVMNQVLGGSSASRLFKNIREDKGYTYGAYSSISSDELVGSFNASASVRTNVTDSSVNEFFYEMKRMTEETVGDEELQLAKNVIIGGFGRSLERPQTIANFAVNIERYNLPADYYNNYVKNVQAVSANDVKAIASQYIKPENAYVVAVGKAGEIAEGLKKFGDVKYFDIYGEEVDPSMAKLPDGLTAEKVIESYKKAIGGDEALTKFNNVVMEMEAETFGQKLPMTYMMTKDLESKLSILFNGQPAMEVIATKDNASTKQMGNSIPMKEEQKEELAFANGIFTEFSFSEFGVKTELTGVEEINGNNAYVIEVTLSKGSNYLLFFDAETGLKVRYSKVLDTPNGPITSIIDYKDYKEVEGVKIFHTLVQQTGPQKMTASVKEIKVNQDIADGTFEVK